jgi:hypothetical protein
VQRGVGGAIGVTAEWLAPSPPEYQPGSDHHSEDDGTHHREVAELVHESIVAVSTSGDNGGSARRQPGGALELRSRVSAAFGQFTPAVIHGIAASAEWPA